VFTENQGKRTRTKRRFFRPRDVEDCQIYNYALDRYHRGLNVRAHSRIQYSLAAHPRTTAVCVGPDKIDQIAYTMRRAQRCKGAPSECFDWSMEENIGTVPLPVILTFIIHTRNYTHSLTLLRIFEMVREGSAGAIPTTLVPMVHRTDMPINMNFRPYYLGPTAKPCLHLSSLLACPDAAHPIWAESYAPSCRILARGQK
jgi:hypothetical protein